MVETSAVGHNAQEPHRERRPLLQVGADENLAIMVQREAEPVFRCLAREGFDYVCGGCRGSVLIENTQEGEFWDIAFRCGLCNELSSAPPLPVGRPYSQPALVMEPGEYPPPQTGTILMDKLAVVISQRAAQARAAETAGSLRGDAPRITPVRIDGPATLEAVLFDAEGLLADFLDVIIEADRRALRHTRTPPRERHRLAVVVAGVRRSLDEMRGSPRGSTQITLDEFTELYLVVQLLRRWRNDPAWNPLVRSMKNPSNYPHALVELAAASYLADLGNAVALAAEVQGNRVPDLWLAAGPHEQVRIEVKAPRALQPPFDPVTPELAERVITSAFEDAGTSRKGQLATANYGILVVGGFYLKSDDVETLEAAAINELRRHGASRRHVIAIMVLSISATADGVQEPRPGVFMGSAQTRLRPDGDVRVAWNQSYDGTVQVVEEP